MSVAVTLRNEGYSHTYRNFNSIPVRYDWHHFNLLPQSLCHFMGLFKIGVWEQNAKFLSTKPGNNVMHPKVVFTSFSYLYQNPIPGTMTMLVVDAFKMVQVNHD